MRKYSRDVIAHHMRAGLGGEVMFCWAGAAISPMALARWPTHPGKSISVIWKWICHCFYLKEQLVVVRRPCWGVLQSCDSYQRAPPWLIYRACFEFFPFLLDGWHGWSSVFLLEQVCCLWGSRVASLVKTLALFSSWLSGFVYIDLLTSPIPGLGKLPASLHRCCVNLCFFLIMLLFLLRVISLIHSEWKMCSPPQIHLGFWDCCGSRCLSCSWWVLMFPSFFVCYFFFKFKKKSLKLFFLLKKRIKVWD